MLKLAAPLPLSRIRKSRAKRVRVINDLNKEGNADAKVVDDDSEDV